MRSDTTCVSSLVLATVRFLCVRVQRLTLCDVRVACERAPGHVIVFHRTHLIELVCLSHFRRRQS